MNTDTYYFVCIDIPSIHEEWTWEEPRFEDHASLIDEGVSRADDSDYIMNQSIPPGGVSWDKYNIKPGPPGIKLVKDFLFQFRWSGEEITHQPGLRFKLYVGGVQKGSTILVDAAYPLQNGQVRFVGINIDGPTWYAGPRVIWVGSDGEGGGRPKPDERELEEQL